LRITSSSWITIQAADSRMGGSTEGALARRRAGPTAGPIMEPSPASLAFCSDTSCAATSAKDAPFFIRAATCLASSSRAKFRARIR
jgi:hypothetical protein